MAMNAWQRLLERVRAGDRLAADVALDLLRQTPFGERGVDMVRELRAALEEAERRGK